MNVIETINKSWKWMQIQAKEVAETNLFGHVIFSDADGKFWRIRPEELSCDLLAMDKASLEALMEGEEFKAEWGMKELVRKAKDKLGVLSDGWVYCLKFPPVLGGDYEEANLGTIRQAELLNFSGEMAFQIKDLPDGAKINIDLEGLFP